jgi:hypothetical protein
VKPNVCNRRLLYVEEKGIKNHKKKHTHREGKRREGFVTSTSSNRIANAVGKFCGRGEFPIQWRVTPHKYTMSMALLSGVRNDLVTRSTCRGTGLYYTTAVSSSHTQSGGRAEMYTAYLRHAAVKIQACVTHYKDYDTPTTAHACLL